MNESGEAIAFRDAPASRSNLLTLAADPLFADL